ncbi:MAG: hypothetical protein H9W81_06075 [Enterococcus sp.]|nr:hypothetical protein [Enterococcus sp.]
MDNSKTMIDELIALGFSRMKIATTAGVSTSEIAGVKLGQKSLTKKADKALRGLLRWAKAMRDNENFTFKPGAYYEEQIIVFPMEGTKKYTPLSHLYENYIINATQMIELTKNLPELYDYNAFIDEFPDQANINLDDDNEQKLILHHGLPPLEYTKGNKPETKEAIKETLDKLQPTE